MAQQTAVEFLIESIDARGLWTKELRKEAKQAKQMEREQIESAHYISGCYMCHDDDKYERAEQYYTKTYGK